MSNLASKTLGMHRKGTAGNISVSSIVVSSELSLPDGSAAAPALRFTNDPDSGIYRVGADVVGHVVGGGLRGQLSMSEWRTLNAAALRSGGRVNLATANLGPFGASQNDVATGNVSVVYVSATGAINITGFVALDDGALLSVINVSAFNVTLTHQDAASAAANRMVLTGGVNFVLAINQGLTLIYRAADARWRVFS